MKALNLRASALTTISTLVIFAATLFVVTSVEAKKKKEKLNVLMIGIGAKNPTFDESRFPDLTFVYTPGLVSQAKMGSAGKSALALFAGKSSREIYKGTPKVLETWWDKKNLRHHTILFDKNGIGSWEGWLNLVEGRGDRTQMEDTRGKGKKKELSKMLKLIHKKGKTTKVKEGKDFNPKKDNAILNRKMPDFDVVPFDSEESKPISSYIETGKPVLVVFFQISPDVNLKEAKESGKGKSGKSFMKAMMAGAAGAEWEKAFVMLEKHLFGYRVKD